MRKLTGSLELSIETIHSDAKFRISKQPNGFANKFLRLNLNWGDRPRFTLAPRRYL